MIVNTTDKLSIEYYASDDSSKRERVARLLVYRTIVYFVETINFVETRNMLTDEYANLTDIFCEAFKCVDDVNVNDNWILCNAIDVVIDELFN